MLVYAVDLGTTNVKVVLYDEHLRRLAVSSAPAVYQRAGDRVEFSPAGLFDLVVDLTGRCAADAGDTAGHDAVIVLTEWPEFRTLDWSRVAELTASPTVVDTRNLLDPDTLRRAGLSWTGLGRATCGPFGSLNDKNGPHVPR